MGASPRGRTHQPAPQWAVLGVAGHSCRRQRRPRGKAEHSWQWQSKYLGTWLPSSVMRTSISSTQP